MMGPEPMRRILRMSVRFGMASSAWKSETRALRRIVLAASPVPRGGSGTNGLRERMLVKAKRKSPRQCAVSSCSNGSHAETYSGLAEGIPPLLVGLLAGVCSPSLLVFDEVLPELQPVEHKQMKETASRANASFRNMRYDSSSAGSNTYGKQVP